MTVKTPSYDFVTVGCISIAGVIEAGQQALKDSTSITTALPAFFTSSRWNYVPLILILIGAVVWVIGRSKMPALASAKETPVLVPTVEPPLGPSAGELLVFVETLKPVALGATVPSIKFVAGQRGEQCAEFVARCLRITGFKIIDNPSNGTYIYPARTTNDTIIVRSRPMDGTLPTIVYKSTATAITVHLQRLKLPFQVYAADFPENDNYNYIQIEVNGAL